MKKHYIRLSIVICSLILVAVLLGSVFFTYAQIQKVNTEYMDACKVQSTYDVEHFDQNSGFVDVLRHTFSSTWRNAGFRSSDIGFYGALTWTKNGKKGTIVSQDYVRVYYLISEKVEYPDQVRILLLDDRFDRPDSSREDLWNFTMSAGADDVFVHSGTISYSTLNPREEKTYSFRNANPDIDGLDNIELHWGEQTYLCGEYISMSETKAQAKLNQEAEKIYAEVINDPDAGKELNLEKKGWLSSYCIYYASTRYDVEVPMTSYAVYVFHPLEIVLSDNLYVYLLFLIVLFALEALAVFMMNRVYVNRREYELRSRNLTRSVAHELKTPLAVTKAYVENWEYIDEEDRPQISEKINSEVDHMTRLVNSLLDLSKMDTGNVELKPEEVELLSLTRAEFSRLDMIAKERGLEVEWKTDKKDGDYCVPADLELMKMVIGNFLSNAVKYAKKNVKIRFLDNGKSVRVCFCNDGTRIEPRELKHIWDLFYKTDKARTDRFGSSGVGLAVNKSILELHKAKYGCRSDDSETVFWLEMKKGS